MIPEHIATKYESAVKGAARDAYNAHEFARLFTKAEIMNEAWAVCAERYEWYDQARNPSGRARADIRLRLRRWYEAELTAQGYERRQVNGVRRWAGGTVPVSREIVFTFFTFFALLGGKDEAALTLATMSPDDDARVILDMPTEWAMTVRQAFVFAAIMLRDYPAVAAEFYKLERDDWWLLAAKTRRNLNRERALLRVKYGRELDAARFEAIYGVKPPKELAA